MNINSFVNSLRDTVSQVAYQVNTSVNTIIPGNLIHREYEMLKQRCTYGCPGFVWSVHDAIKRDSVSIKASLKDAIGPNLIPSSSQSNTVPGNQKNYDKLYSVFVFDKSQIDRLAKSDRETALEHVKRGVTQLTRLRHPNVLTVHHPLEESRSSLAFVTEHVNGHLESVLKEQRRQRVQSKNKPKDLLDLNQSLGPEDSDYVQDICELDEVQIRAGLIQVCEGLKFLHSANLLHRNICLDNIFVDSNNSWKIAGFDFTCSSLTAPISKPMDKPCIDIVEFTPTAQLNLTRFPALKTLYPSLPSSIIPNWSCSAPEHSNSDSVTFAADIYSLGMISCALIGADADMIDLSYEYGMISDTYKRGIRLRELADRLPANHKSMIMKYAAMNAESRPSLDDYANLPIFNEQQVRAIRDLDAQFTWDRLRKIDFFNSLRDVLPRLSHQVKVNRIARSLFNELVNTEMTPHVLPCIMMIAKDSTPTEFKSKIFPHLKGPFRVLQPKTVPIILLDNLVCLADRARHCLPEFQNAAFTLIQYLLQADLEMQEKCLTVLPEVRGYIDEVSMSSLILPELYRIIRETTVIVLRVKTLICISKLVEVMNTKTIVNSVIPMLQDIPTVDHADVLMASAGIVKTIINNSKAQIGKEIIGQKLLPFLLPLSVQSCLDIQQFNNLMTLIRNQIDRIEREQRGSLSKKGKNPTTGTMNNGPLVLGGSDISKHFLD